MYDAGTFTSHVSVLQMQAFLRLLKVIAIRLQVHSMSLQHRVVVRPRLTRRPS
jgi:hypothetical protein